MSAPNTNAYGAALLSLLISERRILLTLEEIPVPKLAGARVAVLWLFAFHTAMLSHGFWLTGVMLQNFQSA
jgi:hypothetical protein